MRTIDLSKLDLDCTADPLALDLMADGAGDVTAKLVPYSIELNRETIDAGFGAKKVATPPEEILAGLAAYPDGLLCTFANQPE